jgi:hypothetical protein
MNELFNRNYLQTLPMNFQVGSVFGERESESKTEAWIAILLLIRKRHVMERAKVSKTT